MDQQVVACLRRGNPVVFFDISIGGTPSGRIRFELFKKQCPKTVENFRYLTRSFISCFRQFCTGEFCIDKVPVGYKNTKFHRVIKGFMIQGGDFMKGDGTGSFSIYGDHFDDENLEMKFDQPGLLAMANSGPNTNGCQFFITTVATPHLNGKHVIFGRLLDEDSMLVVRKIENLSCEHRDQPRFDVVVTECGEM